MMSQVSRESVLSRRRVSEIIYDTIALAMTLYHFAAAGFGLPEPMIFRAVHVSFVVTLAFLRYPFRRSSKQESESKTLHFTNWIFAVVGAVAALYIIVDYERIIYRFAYVDPLTVLDYVLGVALIILVMEGARRSTGPSLPLLALFFIAYALFGRYLPGPLRHSGVSFERLLDHIYLTPNGIFGTMAGVSATYVFLFVLFGSVFTEAGASEFFLRMANALTSGVKAGPAKASILSSAFFATISSSSVANVYVTGVHTIPLMIKNGMRRITAAAVEAVASNSGGLMPPVMSSLAFLIAELNETTYLAVARAAIVPALMYVASVYLVIHLEAQKYDLPSVQSHEHVLNVLRDSGYLLAPIILIVYLLVIGKTPLYCAFYGTIAAFAVSFVKRQYWLTPARLLSAIRSGVRNAVPIGLAMVCAGIAAGTIELTGMTGRLASLILRLGANNLPLTLVMVAGVTVIFGMGLPAVASFVLVSVFATPALMRLGVPKLVAHLFIFYFANLCHITPPVAMASYAAAQIAGTPYQQTGVESCRIAIVAFLVPFFMVYQPALLLMGTTVEIIQCLITVSIGTVAFAGAMTGWLKRGIPWWGRIACFVAGLLLFDRSGLTDLLGVILLGLVVFQQDFSKSKRDSTLESVS